jgi:ribosomal protein L29
MAELNTWSVADLQKEVAAKREALRAFRFAESGTRTRNVKEGHNLRKEIARLLTEINSRKVAETKK